MLKEQATLIPVNAAQQCVNCKNKTPRGLTCKAFPQGIPKEIFRGLHDHRTPYPGDGGILYDPKDPDNPVAAPYVGLPKELY